MNADDKFFDNLPVGYRFEPTDHELITYYLKNKVLEIPTPLCRIRDEILSKYHPQQLAEKYELNKKIESRWYFFTKRKKNHDKDKRPCRTAGDGFWKAVATKKKIYINGEAVATKATLDYYKGNHSENIKTDWKMHEFVLSSNFAAAPASASASASTANNNDQVDNVWVVCKIYNKKYKPETIRNNNNEDAADDGETPNAEADDSNTNDEDDAETSAGNLNTNTNQASNVINNDDEQISNILAQFVHDSTDHQHHPQPLLPQPQVAAGYNNGNNNYYYHREPQAVHDSTNHHNNQDLHDIYGQLSSIQFGGDYYNQPTPYDHHHHLYPMHNNVSLFNQPNNMNMMMGTSSNSSNQVMPYPVEPLSYPHHMMNGGALNVQPLSSIPHPYDQSPTRARSGR